MGRVDWDEIPIFVFDSFNEILICQILMTILNRILKTDILMLLLIKFLTLS